MVALQGSVLNIFSMRTYDTGINYWMESLVQR